MGQRENGWFRGEVIRKVEGEVKEMLRMRGVYRGNMGRYGRGVWRFRMGCKKYDGVEVEESGLFEMERKY